VDDTENPRVRTVEGIDDLTGQTVIMSDDETVSGKSLILCAETARERGAENIYAFVTHAILSGTAVKSIQESPITKLFITDTVEFNRELAEEVAGCKLDKIETLSVAGVFAEAIQRIHDGQSLSSLFL
jgi:ribose-phosphate pyrophosphokinase